MKVAILSLADYAGSGQRFAEALRAHGHSATLATWQRNVYGYPVDLLADANDPSRVQAIVDAADVVHLKGDWLPSQYPVHLAHKPLALTAGGSAFRRVGCPGHPKPWEMALHPLDAYTREAHAIGALTPDLLYPELGNPVWTPHATRVMKAWKAPELGAPIIIGHSPSNASVKGTEDIVKPAIRMLQAVGHQVELRLIKGVSNLECLALKAGCHLFIDQCRIPAYGLSGVEAMSMGIPLVQYLPPPPERAHPYLQERCPIIGFDRPHREALFMAMHKVLMQGDLKRLHRNTLAYVQQVHGQAAVVATLVELYERAQRKFKLPVKA